jgi:hypothetical protein
MPPARLADRRRTRRFPEQGSSPAASAVVAACQSTAAVRVPLLVPWRMKRLVKSTAALPCRPPGCHLVYPPARAGRSLGPNEDAHQCTGRSQNASSGLHVRGGRPWD